VLAAAIAALRTAPVVVEPVDPFNNVVTNDPYNGEQQNGDVLPSDQGDKPSDAEQPPPEPEYYPEG
jgi:hypothetical protein